MRRGRRTACESFGVFVNCIWKSFAGTNISSLLTTVCLRNARGRLLQLSAFWMLIYLHPVGVIYLFSACSQSPFTQFPTYGGTLPKNGLSGASLRMLLLFQKDLCPNCPVPGHLAEVTVSQAGETMQREREGAPDGKNGRNYKKAMNKWRQKKE